MAEAIARQDAWDVITPSSAGIASLGFVVETTKETLAANGYSTDELRSKPLTDKLWDAAHVVINMTGRPGETLFRGFASARRIGWCSIRMGKMGRHFRRFARICSSGLRTWRSG
jgi:protein-tyrosine-phosphatase